MQRLYCGMYITFRPHPVGIEYNYLYTMFRANSKDEARVEMCRLGDAQWPASAGWGQVDVNVAAVEAEILMGTEQFAAAVQRLNSGN